MQIKLTPKMEENKLEDEKVKQKQLLKEKDIKKQIKVNKVVGGISLKKSYDREFKYPLNINLKQLVQKLESANKSSVQPINEHNYHFLYTPTNSCLFEPDNSTHSKIVILVKSSVNNFERREVIRRTWGKYLEKNMLLVFLLGLPSNGNLAIRKESTLYGDIIQENFIDSYWNNTVKMIMAYRWAVSFCDTSDYLFFVDDDYFVNIDNLQAYITKVKNNKLLFSGTFLGRSVPYRANGSKWFIAWEDYPFDRWPPYLAGGAYFVSMPLARKFNLAFPFVKPMHIDDVYLGIVAKKLEIRPSQNKDIGYRRVTVQSLRRYIACHGYDKKEDVEQALTFIRQKKVPLKPPKMVGQIKMHQRIVKV
ncbi:beta-1,3-galactosyltransferase brn-like [Mytilus californianus]|uniref:beta-1,3-galactosyltransferase brn-like n=1 Tax=Mytilus californianus TaxID=6549 RepID=UPI0022473892|nr:beta-1,3-galactosyltransferase brn-like [Mytilus californianus]